MFDGALKFVVGLMFLCLILMGFVFIMAGGGELPPELIQSIKPVLAILAVMGVGWLTVIILRSRYAVVIVVMIAGVSLALGMAYLFMYSAGPDGGNTQVVQMVQPSGDPVIDSQYAAINQGNANASNTNSRTFGFYMYPLLAVIVIFSIVGLALQFKG